MMGWLPASDQSGGSKEKHSVAEAGQANPVTGGLNLSTGLGWQSLVNSQVAGYDGDRT
jgi:hypothetical protein